MKLPQTHGQNGKTEVTGDHVLSPSAKTFVALTWLIYLFKVSETF